MKGSIRKRGKFYEYRFSYTINGKRKEKSKSGFNTKKECQTALTSALNEYNTTGDVIKLKNITIDELYSDFKSCEGILTRKHTTLTKYESLQNNHVSVRFKDMYIYNITPKDIQSFYAEKLETLSTAYVLQLHNFLHLLFGYAMRMKYIRYNPMVDVVKPKIKDTNAIHVYDDETLKLISDRLQSTNIHCAFMLGLHLGLRASEIYALTWHDVDFENNTIKIDKQLQYVNGTWAFDTLKTKNSYRTIKFGNTLHDYLLNKLKERKELEKQINFQSNRIIDNRKEKIKLIVVNDFINIKQNGIMLNSHSHKFASRILKNEFNIDFKFHDLRHTHATKLLENGLNPKYIQQRLGHSKLDFTLKLYTHVTANMDNKLLEILNNEF